MNLPRIKAGLRSLYAIWMHISEVMGWINSRILLSLLYYLLIVPMGLLMRVLGHGQIRKTNTNKGGSLRQPSHNRTSKHFERLF
jgi:hypothetical protein